MDALAEEEYSRQVFEAEERERLRANLNQYRDQQPIFTAEVCNDLNERWATDDYTPETVTDFFDML